MNAERYQEAYFFQQDNGPTYGKLESHFLAIGQPNLLWSILARKVYKNGRQFANKAELKEAIEATWQNIGQDEIQSLFDSLPPRIIVLHDVNGKYTNIDGNLKPKYQF